VYCFQLCVILLFLSRKLVVLDLPASIIDEKSPLILFFFAIKSVDLPASIIDEKSGLTVLKLLGTIFVLILKNSQSEHNQIYIVF
jgi:hypothetical protein